MRILASVILLSLALNIPVGAKAETKGVLNRNTKIKLQNGLDTIVKSNDSEKAESDSNATESRNKIVSANDNFIKSVYISDASKTNKKMNKPILTRTYSVPSGSFTVNASAYTAAADECGKSDGITASGVKVHRGTLACPKNFPFGTKIDIEGMGIYVCEDRGGAIRGNHVDIYMPTKSEAFAFGRRNLIAMVVE